MLSGQLATSNPKSLDPSVFRRTNLFDVDQLYEVKSPPTRILFPVCIARVLTLLLENQTPPTLNPVSIVPSVFKRVILPTAVPQLYEVKFPPTTILPLPSIAKAYTTPILSNQIQRLKLVSLVPSVLRRMILCASYAAVDQL